MSKQAWTILGGLLATLAIAPATARGDSIYCWDGRHYEGRVVSEHADRLVVATPAGRVSLWRDEVKRIFGEGRARVEDPAGDRVSVRYFAAVAGDAQETRETRLYAIHAIATVPSRAALSALASLLDDPMPELREAARAAFVRAARPPLGAEVVAILEAKAHAPSASARVAALRCLGTGDPACDGALAAALVTDGCVGARIVAVDGLARSGTFAAQRALRSALDDRDAAVRGAAVDVIEARRRATGEPDRKDAEFVPHGSRDGKTETPRTARTPQIQRAK